MIIELIRELKARKKLREKFLEEHGSYLINYWPETGQKLDWKVCVVREGPYDHLTGEKLGDLKVVVEQKPPKWTYIDDRIFYYDKENKKVCWSKSVRWR